MRRPPRPTGETHSSSSPGWFTRQGTLLTTRSSSQLRCQGRPPRLVRCTGSRGHASSRTQGGRTSSWPPTRWRPTRVGTRLAELAVSWTRSRELDRQRIDLPRACQACGRVELDGPPLPAPPSPWSGATAVGASSFPSSAAARATGCQVVCLRRSTARVLGCALARMARLYTLLYAGKPAPRLASWEARFAGTRKPRLRQRPVERSLQTCAQGPADRATPPPPQGRERDLARASTVHQFFERIAQTQFARLY